MVKKHITIYHFDESWSYKQYVGCIQFTQGSTTNQGYEQSNDCSLWLFYKDNKDMDVADFNVGDIISIGLNGSINSQADITKSYFNITSIQNNDYGTSKANHIMLRAS